MILIIIYLRPGWVRGRPSSPSDVETSTVLCTVLVLELQGTLEKMAAGDHVPPAAQRGD